ncbi:hypothetical protein DU478_18825 [Thalassococcus profundi]|uniref:Uncharacterized protein n=1 Tax=Thalassococcus profundi TaxID=2282382 RepID=A0A369TJ21_9RHOB|nr:hypothetical protein DU478_18825 [Thalassococcus profundi]
MGADHRQSLGLSGVDHRNNFTLQFKHRCVSVSQKTHCNAMYQPAKNIQCSTPDCRILQVDSEVGNFRPV